MKRKQKAAVVLGVGALGFAGLAIWSKKASADTGGDGGDGGGPTGSLTGGAGESRDDYWEAFCASDPTNALCTGPGSPLYEGSRCAPGWMDRIPRGTPEWDECHEQELIPDPRRSPDAYRRWEENQLRSSGWSGAPAYVGSPFGDSSSPTYIIPYLPQAGEAKTVAFSNLTKVMLALPETMGPGSGHNRSTPSGWASASAAVEREGRGRTSAQNAAYYRERALRAERLVRERGDRQLHRPQTREDWEEQIQYGRDRWARMDGPTRRRVVKDWNALATEQRRWVAGGAYSYLWETSNLPGAKAWRRRWAQVNDDPGGCCPDGFAGVNRPEQFAPGSRFAPCGAPPKCRVVMQKAVSRSETLFHRLGPPGPGQSRSISGSSPSYIDLVTQKKILSNWDEGEMRYFASKRFPHPGPQSDRWASTEAACGERPPTSNCVLDLHVFIAQWFDVALTHAERTTVSTGLSVTAEDQLYSRIYNTLEREATPEWFMRLRGLVGNPGRDASRAQKVLTYHIPITTEAQWSRARREGLIRARELYADPLKRHLLADARKDWASSTRITGMQDQRTRPYGYKVYPPGHTHAGEPYQGITYELSPRGDGYRFDWIPFLAQWEQTTFPVMVVAPRIAQVLPR
jgi:hypothetical protein